MRPHVYSNPRRSAYRASEGEAKERHGYLVAMPGKATNLIERNNWIL